MEIAIENIKQRFSADVSKLEQAPSFVKKDRRRPVLSQANLLLRTPEGRDFVYAQIPRLISAGIFLETVWEHPQNLVAGLVRGTILSGSVSSTMEALSELRLLAVMEGGLSYPAFSADQARHFLEDVLVKNFDLAFEPVETIAWRDYHEGDLRKARLLLELIRPKIPLGSLKERLLEEIETNLAHRPIVTTKVEGMLAATHARLELDPASPIDEQLAIFQRVLFGPTESARDRKDQSDYLACLQVMDRAELATECQTIGRQMLATGLVSRFQATLLRYVAQEQPQLVPDLLALDAHGRADYERHQAFVRMLIAEFITPAMRQGVYGLARVLQRNLLSRKIAWHAFNRLIRIKVHPEIARKLMLGNQSGLEASPIQLLVNGILCVLGHPLGVRQGNNPTCQSARGISMWSRNAPGKLLNLLIDAATTNNIIIRYEGELLESATSGEGLVNELDFKLDPVSIVLVPHLDKIYNEMMRRAGLRYPHADPHISVNPAFYGHWIQTGFRSVFNPVLQCIDRFEEFVRIFYASYHLEYNDGHHISYPVPLGIFITDAAANRRGYHAISLMRVEEWEGQWRAYFFNPNSEGKQNWGQGIEPSVIGNGEKHGESSLPFEELVARVYAFHYNQLRLGDKLQEVPGEWVQKVERLAKESWGRAYNWRE